MATLVTLASPLIDVAETQVPVSSAAIRASPLCSPMGLGPSARNPK
jgi:hypothetical protein